MKLQCESKEEKKEEKRIGGWKGEEKSRLELETSHEAKRQSAVRK